MPEATPPPTSASKEDGAFAPTAARLAGLAARALGWRPAEFWSATPAELALSLGGAEPEASPPTRAELMTLIEREDHARSD